jgi:hypothetical protein
MIVDLCGDLGYCEAACVFIEGTKPKFQRRWLWGFSDLLRRAFLLTQYYLSDKALSA